ncbi:MAG: hypothetical protein Q4C03_04500 [bacterium]|nr:hypothetical protein [bacterium]
MTAFGVVLFWIGFVGVPVVADLASAGETSRALVRYSDLPREWSLVLRILEPVVVGLLAFSVTGFSLLGWNVAAFILGLIIVVGLTFFTRLISLPTSRHTGLGPLVTVSGLLTGWNFARLLGTNWLSGAIITLAAMGLSRLLYFWIGFPQAPANQEATVTDRNLDHPATNTRRRRQALQWTDEDEDDDSQAAARLNATGRKLLGTDLGFVLTADTLELAKARYDGLTEIKKQEFMKNAILFAFKQTPKDSFSGCKPGEAVPAFRCPTVEELWQECHG